MKILLFAVTFCTVLLTGCASPKIGYPCVSEGKMVAKFPRDPEAIPDGVTIVVHAQGFRCVKEKGRLLWEPARVVVEQ